MYEKELGDMLLKDRINRELEKLENRVNLDVLKEVINKDMEYIKDFEKETKETESIIEEKSPKNMQEIKNLGEYKEVLLRFFKHILRNNKKYIEDRRKTNSLFNYIIEELRNDL